MAEFTDLLQSQIKNHCKLSMPDGLKELMSDISREVLRAQPKDLYGFITKYLAALLVSRENLSIASRVCQDVCSSTYHPELDSLLKDIGLSEEDATKAKEIIDKYFKDGGANEQTLMSRLMMKTNLSKTQLPALQCAIQEAFLQHQFNITQNDTDRKMPTDDDEISRAAIHTLELYAKTGPSDEEYNQKANKIQTAYRAYGLRRFCVSNSAEDKREKRNIQFVASLVHDTEDKSTEGTDSSYGSDNNSFFHESEVSAIHFVEPKTFSAKESKTILKSDSNTKDNLRSNTSIVPKVSFIDPMIIEISKQTLHEDDTIADEDADYSIDDSGTSNIKLARNSHNMLKDVETRRGLIGGSIDADDESDKDRYSISSAMDVIDNIQYDIAEQCQEESA